MRGWDLPGGDPAAGCQILQCKCPNGRPTTDCLKQGQTDCDFCDDGFALVNPTCAERWPQMGEQVMLHVDVPPGPYRHGLDLGVVYVVRKKAGCDEFGYGRILVEMDVAGTKMEIKMMKKLGLEDVWKKWEVQVQQEGGG